MDLKDEIENELAMAILIEKRHARKIDDGSGRELIVKIKGALDQKKVKHSTDIKLLPLAEAATSR